MKFAPIEFSLSAENFRNFQAALLPTAKSYLRKAVEFLHPQKRGCAACNSLIRNAADRVGLEPSFPVDAVITWVDGNEPAFKKTLRHYAAEINMKPKGGRYRDNGELRYVLRSLRSYAPWLRTIHLVTNGQRPKWLNAAHPILRPAHHRDFIPAEFLPTFNSHVIEAFLHRLPGLAEHFIYFNDDVFLARPTKKADFFTTNGLPLAFTDWRPLRKFGYGRRLSEHASSWYNTVDFLVKRGIVKDRNKTFISAHGPFPQTVTNAAGAFSFFQDIILKFSQNRFRSHDDIALYCHAAPLWLYEQKSVVPCDERYYYIQNRQIDRRVYYKALLRSKEQGVAPLFFCINDSGRRSKSDWRKDLRRVLSCYFPTPSDLETGSRK